MTEELAAIAEMFDEMPIFSYGRMGLTSDDGTLIAVDDVRTWCDKNGDEFIDVKVDDEWVTKYQLIKE